MNQTMIRVGPWRDGAVVEDPLGGLQLDRAEYQPNELNLKGPFADYFLGALTIRNPTSKPIAFKIQTIELKKYCFKPDSGVIDSSQSMEVHVVYQSLDYGMKEKNKNNHNFIVQYLYLNYAEMKMTVNDMWKYMSTSQVLELKFKSVFDFIETEQQEQQRPPWTQKVASIFKSSQLDSSTSPAAVVVYPTQKDTITDNLSNELKLARHDIEQLKKDMKLIKQENMGLNDQARSSRNTRFIQQLDEFI